MRAKPAWNRSTRLEELSGRAEERGEQDAGPAQAQGERRGRQRSRRGSRAARAPAMQPPSSTSPPPPPPPPLSDLHGASDSEDKEITRAMIERAVTAAFGSVMMEPSPPSGEPEGDDVQRQSDSFLATSSGSPPHHQDKENNAQNASPIHATAKPRTYEMKELKDRYTELRESRSQRKVQHDNQIAQAQSDAKNKGEFLRRLSTATAEFHKRKVAIHALHERVQQEIQYLRATAADLDMRQQLLEEAYKNYEQALRLEYGQHE